MKVGIKVNDLVHNLVDDSVCESVLRTFNIVVWHSVHNLVWHSVDLVVWHSIRDSVRDSVRNSVHDSVRNSVHDSVHDSVPNRPKNLRVLRGML
jgi:hypothetical protein